MKENPLVTVVMPVYKVEKYIKDSIVSVIEQTYKNIEVILVDDGSPDKCPQICDKFASEYDNIYVIHKENGGLSEARNVGINQASGEYILFLDSDDTLTEGAIEGLVKKAIETEADIVIPDRYNQINENTNKEVERFHFDEPSFITNPVMFAIDVIIGKGRAWRASALLYRASIIKDNKIEFPVGFIAEDIVFNLAIMSSATKLSFYKNSTLNYLKRSGSITTSFQENLGNTFLFIDNQICRFLKENNQYNEYSNKKRNELLCRNTIVYISDIFSKKCNWEKNTRRRIADAFLENKRIRDAFAVVGISPYFDNKLTEIYFRIMFKLIRTRNKKVAYLLAELVGHI